MRQYISSSSILSNEPVFYYLMDENDCLKEMVAKIKEVNEILDIPCTTLVRLLLDHFHWDQDALTDRYWEDPDRLFRLLNFANPNSSVSLNPLSPSSDIDQDSSLTATRSGYIICRTCYSEKPANEFYSLACQHRHCLTCWQSYVESNIKHNGNAQKISCPSRCNYIVDDEKIFKFLSNDEQLKKRYQKILINTFVESNRSTHWCPGKSCPTIVKIKVYSIDRAQRIFCDICKITFCFECLKQWHEPVQCSILKKWEKKNRDESMTSEWIVAHTKDCPKCHSSIEKNGGCNHMTCRKPGCLNEFCWLCLGPWSDHAARQCNVYQEDGTNTNQVSARANLARYMHYFTRYQTHNQSLELEDKYLLQVEERIQEMQAESKTFTEQQAIYKAFDVLQQCRRTLKYTYAFAYYLYRNNQAEVFEQNQADLERATESLSGFLEQGIDADHNISLKLMDKTSYCDQRRQMLLGHCKEGYSDHYWGGLDPY